MKNVGCNERGATMIEAVMVLGLFLLMLLVMFESVYIGYNSLTMQFVASRAARFTAVSTLPAGQQRTTAVRNFIVQQAATFGIRLDPATQISICPINRDPDCSSYDAGRPGEFVLLRIWVPARFFLGRFSFTLHGEALTKNEYF